MNILVDTSVWIDHFRNGNDVLVELILQDRVLTHPMVILELACGTPPEPRKQTLNEIGMLQMTKQSSYSEVLDFIEREKLFGQGCGLVDMSLLASTLITPDTKIWTLDKRLLSLAEQLDASYRPSLH